MGTKWVSDRPVTGAVRDCLVSALPLGMEPPRRSPRLAKQPQPQQQQRPPRNKPRDPEFGASSVLPSDPLVWVCGVKEGVHFRVQYESADDEETVRLQYKGADGKWRQQYKGKDHLKPTIQDGYARFQFAVGGGRVQLRRARLFAFMVHGPPPRPSEEFEADHATKVDGVWARHTGPVEWLTKKEHGEKHGSEGAAAARKRRQEAEAVKKQRPADGT